jgi:hypothetical protein
MYFPAESALFPFPLEVLADDCSCVEAEGLEVLADDFCVEVEVESFEPLAVDFCVEPEVEGFEVLEGCFCVELEVESFEVLAGAGFSAEAEVDGFEIVDFELESFEELEEELEADFFVSVGVVVCASGISFLTDGAFVVYGGGGPLLTGAVAFAAFNFSSSRLAFPSFSCASCFSFEVAGAFVRSFCAGVAGFDC